MTSPRSTIRRAIAIAALTAGNVVPALAATGSVSCTIFVGGKASQTQTYKLDEDGNGRETLVFEANMYSATVKIEAVGGQVKADMDMQQDSPQRGGTQGDYAALRGTVPGPASQEIRVINGRLQCELGA